MPGSKKGRLSGAARKEINERRSTDIVNGKTKGILFARVTKMLGANHVTATYPTEKHGTKELRARIPNIFSRKGATPITTRDVVAIEVGQDFDPDTAVIRVSDLFDIKAVLTPRQVYALQQSGEIPIWMSSNVEDPAGSAAGGSEAFEFDYSGLNEEGVEAAEKEADGSAGFSRKTAYDAATGDDGGELDIDNI